jgi:hypothetical protein
MQVAGNKPQLGQQNRGSSLGVTRISSGYR